MYTDICNYTCVLIRQVENKKFKVFIYFCLQTCCVQN